MITTSESLAKISPALVEAEGAIGGALKDASNTHFKSKYATLTAIVSASKAALKDAKIAVIQSPGRIADNSIQMTTRLLHSSGEWIETVMDVPLGKRDPQGMGSTTTYGRRYALAAALNIPVVDDDAESGMLRGEPAEPAEPVETIDAERAKLISNNLEAVDGNLDAILSHFKVDALVDLTPAQADKVEAQIKAKADAKLAKAEEAA
jgi:hypothetical protein